MTRSAVVLFVICIALFLLDTHARVRGSRRRPPRRTVDVVVFANPAYAAGVAAMINSSRVHSSTALRFFLGFDGDPAIMVAYLDCVGVGSSGITVRRPVELVDRSDIPKAPKRHGGGDESLLDKTRLATAANYARFLIPKTFPEVKVAWYFDSDALPVGNLAGAEHANFSRSGRLIQPALRDGTIEPQFDRAVLPIYRSRTGKNFHLEAPSWNAGVWLADFSQWEKLRIADEAVFWVEQANEFAALGHGRLWKLSTQPIMYLIFHDAVKRPTQFLSHTWNCESRDHSFNQKVPSGCHVIHWNGGEKPWEYDANGHQLWRKYLPRFDKKSCQALIADGAVQKKASDTPSRSVAAATENASSVNGDVAGDPEVGDRPASPGAATPTATSRPTRDPTAPANRIEATDVGAPVDATVQPVMPLGVVSSDGGAIGVAFPAPVTVVAREPPDADGTVRGAARASDIDAGGFGFAGSVVAGGAVADGAGSVVADRGATEVGVAGAAATGRVADGAVSTGRGDVVGAVAAVAAAPAVVAADASAAPGAQCLCVVDCSFAAAEILGSLKTVLCDAASAVHRNPAHPKCPARDATNVLFQPPAIDTRLPGEPPSPSASQTASTPLSPSPAPVKGPTVDRVDIVLLTDARYALGVAAIVNAARHYHSVPVRVFIGVDGPTPAAFSEFFSCLGIAATNVVIRPIVPLFDLADMPKAVIAGRERLQTPSNYARFTIHKTFPELRVAVYLDGDALPVADFSEAVAAFAASGAMIKPSGRMKKRVSYAFHPDFAPAYRAHYGVDWVGDEPSFNGGVWIADFAQWERENVDAQALFWVQANAARVSEGRPPFWDLATQPLLYAIFNRDLRPNVMLSASRTAPSIEAARALLESPVAGAAAAERGGGDVRPPPASAEGGQASPEPDWSHAFLLRAWNCNGADACVSPLCRVLHWYHEDKPWEPKTPGHALWAAHLPRAALKPQCAAELLRQAPR